MSRFRFVLVYILAAGVVMILGGFASASEISWEFRIDRSEVEFSVTGA